MPRFHLVGAENPPLRAPWWSERESVTLRPRKTYIATQRAQARGVRFPEGVTPDELQAMPQDEQLRLITENQDVGAIQLEMMLQMVEAITDEDGNPVPVTRELLESLDERDGEWLMEEINKRGGSVTEEAPAVSPEQFPGAAAPAAAGGVPRARQPARQAGAV